MLYINCSTQLATVGVKGLIILLCAIGVAGSSYGRRS